MPYEYNRTDNFTKEFLENDTLRFIDLVRIELPSGTLFYTNYEADAQITSEDGSTIETYLTGAGYLGHNNITLTSQVDTEALEISFDATLIDSTATNIAGLLANGTPHGAPIQIRKGYVDSTGVAWHFIAYKGIIDTYSFKFSADGADATIFCGGEFSNFDKVSLYGFTNTTSQSKVYPLDTGFKYAEKNHSNIRWEE
jgi:hypothetical protein